MPKKILCIIGTRPEVIKMAPIVFLLKKASWCTTRVVATAQHREMLDQILETFKIVPDVDLNVMEKDQSLPSLSSKMMTQLDALFRLEQPDAIIAQGDTTTTLIAALAAFYLHVPFYHVEAGLRTFERYNPFPEEMNRVLISHLASLHFAPTGTNKNNLLREGVAESSIFVTGNTVVDALHYIIKLNKKPNLDIDPQKRLLLVTSHRRENFGKPLLEICKAVKQLVEKFDDIQILYPVHLNPRVRKTVFEQLGDQQPHIILTDPLDYAQFVAVLDQAYLVLTDSGGVQEEAPVLGKPVLILRETTERPEGVSEGVAKLVDLKADDIFTETAKLLESKSLYESMVKKVSPYGDGTAARQIVAVLEQANFH